MKDIKSHTKESILLLCISFSVSIITIAVLLFTIQPVKAQIESLSPNNPNGNFTVFIPLMVRNQNWAGCTPSSFGIMMNEGWDGDRITPMDIMFNAHNQLGIKGLVGAGAPSPLVRDNWFGNLPGWTRTINRGKFSELDSVYPNAKSFGMEDLYECLGYGPESGLQADTEALDPLYWVPQAETLAEASGKCLLYGPAVADYERLATPEGQSQPSDTLLAELIAQIAPHVDIWVIQTPRRQDFVERGRDYNGQPFTMDDYQTWANKWVTWIKTSNQQTKVLAKIKGGDYDRTTNECFPPPSIEYLLNYRERLVMAGVDGVWLMPSLICQDSSDSQHHEAYLQTLEVFQGAIEAACSQ